MYILKYINYYNNLHRCEQKKKKKSNTEKHILRQCVSTYI